MDLPGLVESFVGIDVAQTTAALYVIAALTTDELAATKIRRELPRRHQPVPDQVRDIAELRVASAWLAHDRLGDGERILLELVWPSGARASVSIYIDYTMGTRVKDAFAVSMARWNHCSTVTARRWPPSPVIRASSARSISPMPAPPSSTRSRDFPRRR